MKKKAKIELAMLAGLVMIAGLVWLHSGSADAGSTHAALLATKYQPLGVENPRIHWDRLTEVQSTEYTNSGRSIFSRVLPPPPPAPAPPPETVGPMMPAPPPPPPPPKLPLKLFGSGVVAEGTGARAFLSDGETVFVVAQGDTVLGHYRITRISTASIEFEDLGSGRRASLPVEDAGPAM